MDDVIRWKPEEFRPPSEHLNISLYFLFLLFFFFFWLKTWQRAHISPLAVFCLLFA